MTSSGRPPGHGMFGVTAAACLLAMSCFGAGTNLNRFGFSGPEIFPIDNQLVQLRVADLDSDGLNDLIVVNNTRSKINLLYNQTGKTNLVSKPMGYTKRELNELPPDSRFRIDSIASEKRISCLITA